MSKRERMPITIAVLGITLIVGGAFSFSRAGWEMMKPDYGGMCDADDLYGSGVTGELFSRGEAATISTSPPIETQTSKSRRSWSSRTTSTSRRRGGDRSLRVQVSH